MANDKQYSDIRGRCFQYSLRSIGLAQALYEAKNPICGVLGKQFLRAATSIGANIEEAVAGESRADFIHKYSIAQKEARETLYWLRLIQESRLIAENRLTAIIKETDEIISVITAILVKTKRGLKSEIYNTSPF